MGISIFFLDFSHGYGIESGCGIFKGSSIHTLQGGGGGGCWAM
jgi:hypothetical protein